jgi:hypothetical protein
MMANSPSHAAFISNANDGEVDRRWAEWLYQALSRYSVPREFSRMADQSRKLGSIYWDHESSQLNRSNKTLLDEVARSRVLLVVCSPRARASAWVNDEARHFLERKDPSHLIPVLIEGTPETAYPPALASIPADTQPMRVDLRHARGWRASLDRERELVKIVESIVGCKAGELREGHLRRERRRTRIVASTSLVALTVLTVATIVAWTSKVQADEVSAALRSALSAANASANDERRSIKVLQIAADAATLSSLEADAAAVVAQRSPLATDADRWLAEAEPVLERADEATQLLVALPIQGPHGDIAYAGMREARFMAILRDHLARVRRLTAENGLKARLERSRQGR